MATTSNAANYEHKEFATKEGASGPGNQHLSKDAHSICRALSEVNDTVAVLAGTSDEDPAEAAVIIVRAVASGSLASGCSYARFENVGTTDATVAGIALKPLEFVAFPAPNGRLLPSIAYTASATAILLISAVAA